MKILMMAAGSHGDVLPFIGLGRQLQARGHAVRLYASGPFAAMSSQAGLDFVEVLSTSAYQDLLAHRDATHPRKGLRLLAKAVVDNQRRSLALLERDHEPGRTLLVGSSLAWATRLVGELHRAPVATVHLSPTWFRSDHQSPAIGRLGHLAGAPPVVKRLLWRLMDRRFLDPLFTAPFNAIRAERGLPPVQRLFHQWVHQADLTLGLFPAWFAPRQPDWPADLQLAGFPLYDHAVDSRLPPAVERFLDAGEPPVAFTAGTANASSHAFYEASVQACLRAGQRGLLLTQDPAQLPATLPPTVASVGYVPFTSLLPRLSVLVHHGGIGTTSQALLAGVPQLVRPMGFDQYDNALRVQTLGVARQLLPQRYRPAAVARLLDRLTSDPAVRARCATLSLSLRSEPSGIGLASDALESLGAQHGL